MTSPTAEAPRVVVVRPSRPPSARGIAATATALVAVACCLAVVPWHAALAVPGHPLSTPDLLLGLVWPVVGAVVVSRRPANAVGYVLLAPALIGPYLLAGHYAVASSLRSTPLPGVDLASWFASWGYVPYFVALPLVALLFPDGRTAGRRWRLVPVVVVIGVLVSCLAAMFASPEIDQATWLPNPWALPGLRDLAPLKAIGPVVAFGIGVPLGLWSTVLRLRAASGLRRTQIQWFLMGMVVAAVGLLAAVVFDEAGLVLCVLGPPAGVLVAMLRHRLFDVEIVLSRAVAVTLLVAAVVGGWLLVAWPIHEAAPGSPLALLVVGLIAFAGASLRAPLRRGVDRVLYGRPRDAYAVVAHVGHHMAHAGEPLEALQQLVDTVRTTYDLPFVAYRAHDEAFVIASGTPGGAGLEFPAFVLGRQVGTLSLGRRRGSGAFDDDERAVATELAARAATLGHAAELVARIGRNREEIILAREEERRRLRADLHDGLGPALAGSAHQLDALTRSLAAAGATEHAARAGALRDQVRATVKQVRSIVHGLRPPAVDQLGLAGALRTLVDGLTTPRTTCDVATLPPVPAAVEVAAYAIAGEAVTNALRHSAASHIQLTAHLDGDDLVVEIHDDGCGLPTHPRPGVGLRSMAQRAVEVGGTLDVAPAAGGGTLVRASLPTGTTA